MTAKDERFIKCISDNVETILSLQEQLNKINLTIDLIYKTLKIKKKYLFVEMEAQPAKPNISQPISMIE